MENIKEKEKSDLKQLLNSLIKKWRVPFGDKRITNVSWEMQYVWTYNWVFRSNHNVVQFWKSLRELVSKESWLWQFICKNGMVKNVDDYSWELYDWTHWQCDVYKNWYEWWTRWEQVDYEYRLIESSLKEESELEDFLLQNIKVDG